MKDELRTEMMLSDEDLAEAVKDMSPDEQLAYFRDFYRMIMDDPAMSESIPPEALASFKTTIADLEKAITNEKAANRDLSLAIKMKAIAQAKFDRTADQLLKSWMPDKNH
jgi:hypothetical protein